MIDFIYKTSRPIIVFLSGMTLILLIYISNLNYIYKILLSITDIKLIISYYNQQKEYNLKKIIIYHKNTAKLVLTIFNKQSLEINKVISIKTVSSSAISLILNYNQQNKLFIITCNTTNIAQFKTLRRIAIYNK